MTWSERVEAAYEVAITVIGTSPAEFWAQTPAETADLFVAYRFQENRRLFQRAWELSLMLAPHLDAKSSDAVTPHKLFRAMPGAFPADAPWLEDAIRESEGLSPDQRAERERRLNRPRLQRPQ